MSAAAAVLPFIWATAEQVEVPAVKRVSVRTPGSSGRAGSASEVLAGASKRRVGGTEVAFYRKYTEGMLRRYVKLSMEAGRTPSLLGRELFRGKVTSCRVQSFEDVVIFVHDMEKCVAKLSFEQQVLIRRIGMQEYSQGEAAEMLGLCLRTTIRRYAEALDRLTRILVEAKMLEPLVECQ